MPKHLKWIATKLNFRFARDNANRKSHQNLLCNCAMRTSREAKSNRIRLYITVRLGTACTPTKLNCKLLIFSLAAIIWYWKLNHDTKLRKVVNQYCLFRCCVYAQCGSRSPALAVSFWFARWVARAISNVVNCQSPVYACTGVACDARKGTTIEENRKTECEKLFAMRITFRFG